MKLSRFASIHLYRYGYGAFAIAFAAVTACVPMTRPTLNEARLGQGRLVSDTNLQPGEIRGEIIEIQPAQNQFQVRTADNRMRLLEYDLPSPRVLYHEREHSVKDLQAGDIIAFRSRRRGNTDYVDTIRVQEPVQARAGSTIARQVPPPPRLELVEGTVERIDQQRGVFDVRQRNGETITVALPYNARSSEVDAFRRLRSGDYVKVEGEFINRDNFQLVAFAR